MKKMPKNAEKFHCKTCDFVCSKESNWKKHLLTRKHKMEINGNEKNAVFLQCELCSRKYKTISGLWKHKKKCTVEIQNKITPIFNAASAIPINSVDSVDSTNSVNTKNSEKYMGVDYKDMLCKALEHIQEQQNVFKEELNKKDDMMINMMNKICNTRNNTTNNNTTNNNQFNINIFLNETCKDAMNLTDFIKGFHSQLEDLELMKDIGYVEGVTKIFINGLNQLELSKRPLHCSDAKREILYVKEDNTWGKDTNREKISKAISTVGRKTLQHFPEWMENHPKCNSSESVDNKEYHLLIKNTITENTDDNKKKIAKNIVKEVVIDKFEANEKSNTDNANTDNIAVEHTDSD